MDQLYTHEAEAHHQQNDVQQLRYQREPQHPWEKNKDQQGLEFVQAKSVLLGETQMLLQALSPGWRLTQLFYLHDWKQKLGLFYSTVLPHLSWGRRSINVM